MMKCFPALFLSIFFFIGCATVTPPKIETPAGRTICDQAVDYVAGVNSSLDQLPNNSTTTELVYCHELPHGNAYFIYSGIFDVEGVEDAGEIHVFVVLKKVGMEWRILMEEPFITVFSPEAKKRLNNKRRNKSLEVYNDQENSVN